MLAILGLIDLVNGADVGMIQSRSCPGLVNEPRLGLGIAGQAGGQEFQGDKTLQPHILSLIDDAHAALADLLENFIMGNDLTDHVWNFPIEIRDQGLEVLGIEGFKDSPSSHPSIPRIRGFERKS